MKKETKYVKGYKGPGMCKYCAESYWSKPIRQNWCTYWHSNLYKAVKICKGIINETGQGP